MKQVVAKPVAEVVDFLRRISPEVPSLAVILGSGVKVLDGIPKSTSVPYEEVFGMSPSVVGHAGSLTLGRVSGKLVAVLRGRFHLYEGHDWDVVTLPTRVLVEWGVPSLVVTNAAGGLNRSFSVGDLMVITGYRDLLNPGYKETGLLEVIQQEATDCHNKLTEQLLQAGKLIHSIDQNFRTLQKGVYAGCLGPNYETLAEIEMLRRLKCDAVGMSTVPELAIAKGTSCCAAGVSVVTNVWREDLAVGGHKEVLDAAAKASERLDQLIRAAIIV